MTASNITQELLKEKLTYNHKSGLFYWNYTKRRITKGELAGSDIGNGYIGIQINKKRYLAHRLAWLYMTGTFPEKCIDHINHITDDNRWENLREVTVIENQQNASKRVDNKSGVTGVIWSKRDNRWTAQITVDKKRVHLGSFVEFSEAVNARKNAEVLYGFHENHGKERIA